MSDFKGVFPVVMTPFDEDGSINFELLSAHVDWLIKGGVHGLIPNGSTGEYAAMSIEEQKSVIKCVVDAAKGRVPVVAGVTAETADRVIDLATFSKDCGADGLMALPPPYNKPTMDEVYNHFKVVSEGIDLPMMVYNNPWSTGVDIDVATMCKIAKLPHMEYCKECTGNIRRQRQIQLASGYGIKIFSGWDDLAFEAVQAGAYGWVSMGANVFPEKCSEMMELALAKQYDEAWEKYLELLPWLAHLEDYGNSKQAIKYAATLRGRDIGVCRQPFLPISEAQKKEVERVTENLL